jgi:hypothetical protein
VPAFTVRRVGQAGQDVFASQVGKVGKESFCRHPRGEVIEDLMDRDPQSADASFPPAFARFEGDVLAVVHGPRLRRPANPGNVDALTSGWRPMKPFPWKTQIRGVS